MDAHFARRGVAGITRQGGIGAIAAILALLGAAVLLFSGPGQAAFPGVNGKIAFVNTTAGGDAVFSVNPDGSGLTQLTVNPNDDDDPAWSADGARIAFTRGLAGPGGPTQVWVMNANGSGQMQLTTGSNDCDPYFLPDGRVVFVRAPSFCPEGGDILIRNLDGTEVNLTPGSPQDDFTPTASPDGQTVAFARGAQAHVRDSVIFTVTSGGGAVTPVTNDHGADSILDTSPNFSPDGATIAFDRCSGGEGCFAPQNLARVPAAGGAVALITNNVTAGTDPDACQPAYAPDGTRIIFTQLTNSPTNCRPVPPNVFQLAFIGPMGGSIQPFVTGFAPDWGPITATAAPTPQPTPAQQGVAGASTRTRKCRGVPATMVGTHGPDKLIGTKRRDVIHGLKGPDLIMGLRHDDRLCGGRGEDEIFGNKGDDVLFGGAQSDFLNGGPGRNFLFGGTPKAPPRDEHNICVAGPKDSLSNCQEVR